MAQHPEWWVWLNEILSFIVTIIVGSIAATWSFVRWIKRPRFIVGSPPPFKKDCAGTATFLAGKPSVVNQFRHDSACFAKRIQDRQSLSEKVIQGYLDDSSRSHVLTLASDETVTIPIIVENCGKRAASDYILGVMFFEKRVHVINVVTESLQLDAFYSTKPELVTKEGLADTLADEKIVDEYNRYMEIDDYGDVLFFKGVLEGGLYEMIVLEAKIDGLDTWKNKSSKGEKGFVIVCSLDCSDFWISKQAFIQGFKIC